MFRGHVNSWLSEWWCVSVAGQADAGKLPAGRGGEKVAVGHAGMALGGHQGLLTHTERIDDQGEMDEATEHDVEFVKA